MGSQITLGGAVVYDQASGGISFQATPSVRARNLQFVTPALSNGAIVKDLGAGTGTISIVVKYFTTDVAGLLAALFSLQSATPATLVVPSVGTDQTYTYCVLKSVSPPTVRAIKYNGVEGNEATVTIQFEKVRG